MVPRPTSGVVLRVAVALSLVAISCERVPLLAPTGSKVVLTAGNTAIATNSALPVTAQIIEASGTPPHSGTRVTFTTSLGIMQPEWAETDINGQVTSIFRSGSSNGTATITAFSGGASTPADGALKIAVGTAAVGRVTLTANPGVIQSNGGTSLITANVADLNGNILSGVAVQFATSAGNLSASVGTTNASGIATTSLTTTVQATVTATVGVSSGGGTGGTGGGSTAGQAQATVTVNVNPVPTVSITSPSGTLTAGTPLSFTVTAQSPSGSNSQIRRVTVDFGDDTGVADLGALTGSASVQHVFPSTITNITTYTVRATAEDTLGAQTSSATIVAIQPLPPLSVSISKTGTPAGANTNYTFIATVTPSTTTVTNYQWTVDGTPQGNNSNTFLQSFVTGAAHVVGVTITTSTSATASNSVFTP